MNQLRHYQFISFSAAKVSKRQRGILFSRCSGNNGLRYPSGSSHHEHKAQFLVAPSRHLIVQHIRHVFDCDIHTLRVFIFHRDQETKEIHSRSHKVLEDAQKTVSYRFWSMFDRVYRNFQGRCAVEVCWCLLLYSNGNGKQHRLR